MSKRSKATLLHVLGLLICIVPPALSVLEFFPILSETPEKQISTFGVLMLAVCCIPFWRTIKAFFSTPSAWKVWLVIFLASYLLNSIVGELVVISAIGLVSGIAGGAVFRLERWYRIRRGLIKAVNGNA